MAQLKPWDVTYEVVKNSLCVYLYVGIRNKEVWENLLYYIINNQNGGKEDKGWRKV